MTVRIVQLGTPRARGEGLRIGTVRRPPRGVPKAEFASRDFYDVWLPLLAPSEALLKRGQAATDARAWKQFAQAYRKEMAASEPGRVLDVLAALSKQTDFSMGCYCADAQRCHRSLLRELLAERGAELSDDTSGGGEADSEAPSAGARR